KVTDRLVNAAAIFVATITLCSAAAAQDAGNRHRQIFETGPGTIELPSKFFNDPRAATKGEPQILGIVASHGPVPFHCTDEGCRADLSSFCLQQARDNPAPGQSYVPLESADMILSGTNKAGRLIRIAAAPYLDFTTGRGVTDITVTLPVAKLAK